MLWLLRGGLGSRCFNTLAIAGLVPAGRQFRAMAKWKTVSSRPRVLLPVSVPHMGFRAAATCTASISATRRGPKVSAIRSIVFRH